MYIPSLELELAKAYMAGYLPMVGIFKLVASLALKRKQGNQLIKNTVASIFTTMRLI